MERLVFVHWHPEATKETLAIESIFLFPRVIHGRADEYGGFKLEGFGSLFPEEVRLWMFFLNFDVNFSCFELAPKLVARS